jgi:hypothetical protein
MSSWKVFLEPTPIILGGRRRELDLGSKKVKKKKKSCFLNDILKRNQNV